MNDSNLIGIAFASCGFALFVAQVTTVKLARGYRDLKHAINAHYGHDNSIYPDYYYQSGIPQENSP